MRVSTVKRIQERETATTQELACSINNKEVRMLEKSEQGRREEETSCGGGSHTVSEESREDYHLQPLVRTLSEIVTGDLEQKSR